MQHTLNAHECNIPGMQHTLNAHECNIPGMQQIENALKCTVMQQMKWNTPKCSS
jgi:hypothetical protein